MGKPQGMQNAQKGQTQRAVPTAQLDIFDALSMDSEELAVLGLIRRRVGRKQAMQVKEISEATGIAPRTVREIVKTLIERHRVRIGSSLGKPAGYYIIQTLEEAEQNERTLRKLGISILVHAAVLKRVSVRDYLKELQEELIFKSKDRNERNNERTEENNMDDCADARNQ